MSDGVNKRQLQREVSRINFNPSDLNVQDLGDVRFGPDGSLTAALNADQLAQRTTFGNLFRGAGAGVDQLTQGQVDFGRGALDESQRLLRSSAAIDPLDQAETRFNRLQGILERGRGQTRDAAEERLFRQGRLDSGFGAQQLGELEQGFENADTQLLDRLVTSSEDQRRGRLSDALQAGQAGQGISAGLVGRLSTSVAGQGQISDRLLRLLSTSSSLAGRRTAGQVARVTGRTDANLANAEVGGDGGRLLNIGKGVVGGGISGFLSGGVPGAFAGGALGGLSAA